MKDVRIALSSAGGYGYYYLDEILTNADKQHAKLSSVFDPAISQLPVYQNLAERGIPCFTDYKKFVNSLHACDLAVISSPIQYHSLQTIDALREGCHVLLDKPLGGNVSQALKIFEAQKHSSGRVLVGYQWTFSKAIRKLKNDLLNQRFGRIRRAKTLVFWPRNFEYFQRNNWAGKRFSNEGIEVNDSLANNAMAHFIHNLLFLAGDTMDDCAIPVSGKAELYRAYPIETYDTAVIKWTTQQGIEMGFYGSHVTKNPKSPLFSIECDNAHIFFGELSDEIIAVQKNGKTITYGNPDNTPQFNKLWQAVNLCQGVEYITCTPEAAIQQTKIVEALANQVEVTVFDQEQITSVPDDRIYVDGLGYTLLASYQQGTLPTENSFSIKGKIKSFII